MGMNTNYDINQYMPSIQHFAPMIKELSADERFALVKLITELPFEEKPTKKLAPLDVKLFDKVVMSNDFDKCLGM